MGPGLVREMSLVLIKGNQEVVCVEVRARSPGQAVWVQTPALTLTGYETSGMDPSLSECLCPLR